MLFASELEGWIKKRGRAEQAWQGLCLLLVLGILWSVVTAGLSPMRQLERLSPENPNQPLENAPYQIHEEVIVRAPYFGLYISHDSGDISESHLNEEVVGIMFSKNPKFSQVILRAEDGFDKIYRIGESVKSGIVIQTIYPTEIVISNHGKLERLNLAKQKLRFKSPAPPLKLNP
jgi:type II secretory pathway component PulC